MSRPTVAPPPPPITEVSTWQEHRDCDWAWSTADDDHGVCRTHRVRFPLPTSQEAYTL